MSNTSHIDMHQEHKRWRMEDDLWRDELAVWEHESEQAIKDVPRLEKALRDHAEMLRKHAASIRLYEQDFVYHEHALASYEQGEAPSDLVELAQAHQTEAEKHVEQHKAHERIKKQQHALMATWRLLFTALVEAEQSEFHGSIK